MSSLRLMFVQWRTDPIRFPVLLVALALPAYVWTTLPEGNTTWASISSGLATGQIPSTAMLAGLGAWKGFREHNHAIREIMLSAERIRGLHITLSWLSAVTWSVMSFAAGSAVTMLIFGPRTTWGSPEWTVLLLAGIALVAATSFGFAIGIATSGAWAVLVAAAAWFLIDLGVSIAFFYPADPLLFLTPRSLADGVVVSPYYEFWPSALPEKQLLLWLAFATGFLALAQLRQSRARQPWTSILTLSFLMALVAGFSINQLPVGGAAPPTTRSFTPVCDETQHFEVCIHPANQRLLESLMETADAVDHTLPDSLPDSFLLVEDNIRTVLPGDTSFYLYDESSTGGPFAQSLTIAVYTEAPLPDDARGRFTLPQMVLMTATLHDLGVQAEPAWYYVDGDFARNAMLGSQLLDRWNGVPEPEQDAWLLANIDAIRDGTLTSEEMP